MCQMKPSEFVRRLFVVEKGEGMEAKWITPAVTAMNESGHVDFEANSRIYDNLIDSGMDGILILGSIGEFFAIPWNEKKEMIKRSLEAVRGRVKVYVGTGQMELDRCVELSNYALDQGADGVVVISPFYINLPDSAVLNFYGQVAEQVKGDIFLYNFPARTGYDLRPDLVYRLTDGYKNIVGIKDTVGDMGHTRAVIRKLKKDFPDFQIYSGFDEFFGHNVLSGGDGCIAGLSNFAPELAAGYVKAARRNDLTEMCRYQQKIDGLMDIYGVGQQFIPIIKKAMVLRGISMEPYCAQPMLAATEKETEEIRRILSEGGLL